MIQSDETLVGAKSFSGLAMCRIRIFGRTGTTRQVYRSKKSARRLFSEHPSKDQRRCGRSSRSEVWDYETPFQKPAGRLAASARPKRGRAGQQAFSFRFMRFGDSLQVDHVNSSQLRGKTRAKCWTVFVPVMSSERIHRLWTGEIGFGDFGEFHLILHQFYGSILFFTLTERDLVMVRAHLAPIAISLRGSRLRNLTIYGARHLPM